MWTLHKASECKLENHKEDDTKQENDDKGLQLKQALSAKEEDEESVE